MWIDFVYNINYLFHLVMRNIYQSYVLLYNYGFQLYHNLYYACIPYCLCYLTLLVLLPVDMVPLYLLIHYKYLHLYLIGFEIVHGLFLLLVQWYVIY